MCLCMKLGLIRNLSMGMALALCVVACGQAADEATSSNVEELDTDGFLDEDFDGADLDGLGTDPEPMISDDEIDALADRSEVDEETEADALVDAPDPIDEEIENQKDVPARGESKPGAHAG